MALLITFGVLSLFRLTSTEFIIAALLTTAFAALPDIDIRFKIGHRKYTHNILAAIILGLILAFIFLSDRMAYRLHIRIFSYNDSYIRRSIYKNGICTTVAIL